MHRATRWLITLAYAYSQLLGVIAFSYDVDTGYAEKRTHITIYCVISNLLTLTLVPYLALNVEIKARPAGQADLHQKLYVRMALIRISGILLTIVFNWMKRQQFIQNLNDLQDFRETFMKNRPMPQKYDKFYEKQILKKLFVSFMCEVMMSSGTVRVLHDNFSVENPLILASLGLMSTVLNVATCHYFYIFINVRILFSIISEEVQQILSTTEVLFRLQYAKCIGPGVLITHCCRLSDHLDELARAHRELQVLGNRINQMYYVQGSCVILVLYMNNVCVIYMGYMMTQHENVWPQFGGTVLCLVPLALFFYYTDAYLLIFLIIQTIDIIDEPKVLLKDCQAWLPTLDERLERSLQNFSLQMAALPFNRHLLYLFDITRPMVFATISSTVSNAIVLMQYAFKYR